jgi:hypothetical protein
MVRFTKLGPIDAGNQYSDGSSFCDRDWSEAVRILNQGPFTLRQSLGQSLALLVLLQVAWLVLDATRIFVSGSGRLR